MPAKSGIVVFGFFIFFLSLILFARNCQAENKEIQDGFSIAPFFQEITLEKNQVETKFNLELSNNTDFPAVFKLSVLDFGALDESGGVAFLSSAEKKVTNKYSLASWISLEKDALALNPREKQEIAVTVLNKESLSPGGHYAAIVLKMESENGDAEDKFTQVALNPSFASLIFARKLGGEVYGLALNKKEVEKNLFSLPSIVNLRFQNTGNVHVVPRGIVSLVDYFGREVLRGVINQESSSILPETFRLFPVSLKKMALGFLPGRYKILVQYRFDGQTDLITESQTINFIPGLDVLIIAISVIALIGVVVYKKQKNKRKNR